MAATTDVISELAVLTEGCGLLDRSERGKLALAGAGRKEFLNGQVTNDVEALSEGEGCYAAFLTPKGKMLGDVRILDVGPPTHELVLDTERVSLQALFDLIRRFSIGHDTELRKRTVERGLLSLVGPRARAVVGVSLPERVHSHVSAALAGREVRLIVTEEGVDVLCDAADASEVASALRDAGAVDVSNEAAEVLRIERGRPRYGVELDDSVIPQEAGLNERAVSFTKGCYVGQETVARLHYKGKPNRHLRGLRLSAPVEPGTPLLLDGREVGRLGSLALSPRLGPIGLALVRREAPPGSTVAAGDATAEVVELPF